MALGPSKILLLFAIVIPVSSMVQLRVIDEFDISKSYHTLNFTDKTFSEFYKCLCKHRTSECRVSSTSAGEVLLTDRVESVHDYVWSSFYHCKFGVNNLLECKRMDYIGLTVVITNTTTAFLFNTTTAFRHLTTASCDMDCVGLVWKSKEEGSLSYDEETDNIETCVAESSGKKQSQQVVSENQTKKETDAESAIIVGVVLGILLIASFIVIGILVWKLRRRENLKLSTNTGLPSENRHPSSRNHASRPTSLDTTDSGVSGRSFRLLSTSTSPVSQPSVVVSAVNRDEEGLEQTYEQPDGFSLDEEEGDGRHEIKEMDYENTQRPSDAHSSSIVHASSGTGTTGVQNADYGNVKDNAETGTPQGSYSDLDMNTCPNDHNYSGLTPGEDSNEKPTETTETGGDVYEDFVS